MPYFSVDLEKRVVKSEEGDEYTAKQFATIVNRAAENDKFFDMTAMTSRFLSLGCDWERLDDYYKEEDRMKTKSDFFISDYGAGVGHGLFS